MSTNKVLKAYFNPTITAAIELDDVDFSRVKCKKEIDVLISKHKTKILEIMRDRLQVRVITLSEKDLDFKIL